MSLNEYFDEIYLINVDTDVERLAQATEEFEKINTTFQRVSGIVYGGAHTKFARLAGCYLSHTTIMRMAIAHGHTRILICEDDVMFHPDIVNDIPKIVQEDYDILWFQGMKTTCPEDGPFIRSSGPRHQTHCFSINNKIPAVLEHMEKHFSFDLLLSPDQVFFNHPHPTIHHCTTCKYYAVQREGRSNILGRDIKRFSGTIEEWRGE